MKVDGGDHWMGVGLGYHPPPPQGLENRYSSVPKPWRFFTVSKVSGRKFCSANARARIGVTRVLGSRTSTPKPGEVQRGTTTGNHNGELQRGTPVANQKKK